MATIQGRFPSPNPKYPFVGSNYQKFGEQPGLDYNPYTDMYRPNKEAAQGMGLLPPEPEQPGLADQLIPMAATLATMEGVKGLGSMIGEKGISGTIGGLLGGGGGAGGAGGVGALGAAATNGSTLSQGVLQGLLGGSAEASAPFSFGSLMGGTPVTTQAAPSTIGSLLPSGAASIGALPLTAIGLGLLAGGKGVKDLLAGKEGTSSLEGLAGRTTLGIATGGLSELARLAGLGRKSTGDYQDERWGALSEAAQGLRAANHGENDDGIWDEGKFAGQKWSFDKALELAKEDPKTFIGVLGNLETFGDPWLGLTEDQQKQVVSQLLENNLYHSNKGDVLISDPNKARALEIFNSIINPEPTTIDPTKP